MTGRLVLLRHGESTWNVEKRFTGWYDAPLTPKGEDEAREAGKRLSASGILPDVLHTSLQTRAIRTAELALEETERAWIPVHRHWRLNERHYGELTGRTHEDAAEETSREQVHIWRRSWDVRPPAVTADNAWNPNRDERFASIAAGSLPLGESLADVVDRLLPYWYDAIVPQLKRGHCVLVSAHGNSLRALIKHLDAVPSDAIATVQIETGRPILYELNDEFRSASSIPVEHRYL